jgi:hypothetical protein
LKPTTLAIFDYSGTLSLGAVEFGRPDNLERHLEESGLAGIGIDTTDRYWHDVVNPTWTEASISNAGFRSAVAGCIRKLKIPGATPRLIETAVARFLDAYMHHSHIDKRWQPLLSDIQNRPDTLGLVATDHYAEATAAIRAHLAALGIRAAPATKEISPDGKPAFIVANSADIGCLKADRQFWVTLRKTCLPLPVKRLVLVDDFGFNERDCSRYTENSSIENRIIATRQALGGAFGVKPRVIKFHAGRDINAAIVTTIRTVREILQA